MARGEATPLQHYDVQLRLGRHICKTVVKWVCDALYAEGQKNVYSYVKIESSEAEAQEVMKQEVTELRWLLNSSHTLLLQVKCRCVPLDKQAVIKREE